MTLQWDIEGFFNEIPSSGKYMPRKGTPMERLIARVVMQKIHERVMKSSESIKRDIAYWEFQKLPIPACVLDEMYQSCPAVKCDDGERRNKTLLSLIKTINATHLIIFLWFLLWLFPPYNGNLYYGEWRISTDSYRCLRWSVTKNTDIASRGLVGYLPETELKEWRSSKYFRFFYVKMDYSHQFQDALLVLIVGFGIIQSKRRWNWAQPSEGKA